MKRKELLKLLERKSKRLPLKQIIKNICGDKIGGGCYRVVYDLRFDSRYVVKIEPHPQQGNFANALEWFNFINYQGSPLGSHLCPILCISEDSQILIMRKARQATSKEGLPKRLPAAFTDLKIENWGWIGDKPYIFDYPLLIADQDERRAKYWSLKDL